MKRIEFLGNSYNDLCGFPHEARRAAGFELSSVQHGMMPTDFKPMVEVGTGTYEIRIHVLGEWRVLYVAKFDDAVYVLHALQKKTQKTPKSDLDLAAKRYKDIKGKRHEK